MRTDKHFPVPQKRNKDLGTREVTSQQLKKKKKAKPKTTQTAHFSFENDKAAPCAGAVSLFPSTMKIRRHSQG